MAPRARAKKKKGPLLTLGVLASIATICEVVYQIDHTQKEDDQKAAAAAARVHHARLIPGTDVGLRGAILSAAYRQVFFDPVPPLGSPRNVTVRIDSALTVDGKPCTPTAELEVQHNDILLTLARCTIRNGATGTLTWVDPLQGKGD
jgi:hypothetical protein